VKTNVYVDGFNLYYGAVKNTPYRWLDLRALSQCILPENTIQRIRYFTALVDPRPDDPRQRQRQETYIRALRTIQGLEVHYGTFLKSRTRMALAQPPPGGPRTVEVIKTEEKGSDVNLATYLLLDAFEGDYEAALIISNDSDLAEPIRIVRQRFKRRVVVACPYRRCAMELQRVASLVKYIRRSALKRSQLPPVLTDAHGTIKKPPEW